MQLHTKVRYGLRAIIEIAKEGKKGLLQKEISERQQIPLKYLDFIIAGLKTRGLIRNLKGKKSGYILTRPAEEISVYDVYCAFEPELAIVECLGDPSLCERVSECGVKSYWNELNHSLLRSMEQKKLVEFLI